MAELEGEKPKYAPSPEVGRPLAAQWFEDLFLPYHFSISVAVTCSVINRFPFDLFVISVISLANGRYAVKSHYRYGKTLASEGKWS